MFHYSDPISRGVYREHGVAVGAADVAQVLGLRNHIHACLVAGRRGGGGGAAGGGIYVRTSEEPRSGERASSVCVWLSARCVVRRYTNKAAGNEEGEEDGRYKKKKQWSTPRVERKSWVPREDGGRVSIPAIMPGPHAHMGSYERGQPRSDRAMERSWLHHHKSFRDIASKTHTHGRQPNPCIVIRLYSLAHASVHLKGKEQSPCS